MGGCGGRDILKFKNLQISMKNDLGSNISSNDWISKYGTKLCCDIQRVYYCHLTKNSKFISSDCT